MHMTALILIPIIALAYTVYKMFEVSQLIYDETWRIKNDSSNEID